MKIFASILWSLVIALGANVAHAQSGKASQIIMNNFSLSMSKAIDNRDMRSLKILFRKGFVEHGSNGKTYTRSEGLNQLDKIFRIADKISATVRVNKVSDTDTNNYIMAYYIMKYTLTINGVKKSFGSNNKGKFYINNGKAYLSENWVISTF